MMNRLRLGDLGNAISAWANDRIEARKWSLWCMTLTSNSSSDEPALELGGNAHGSYHVCAGIFQSRPEVEVRNLKRPEPLWSQTTLGS